MKKKLMGLFIILSIMVAVPAIANVPCDVQCGSKVFLSVYPQELKATNATPTPEVFIWESTNGTELLGKCVGPYSIKYLIIPIHIP